MRLPSVLVFSCLLAAASSAGRIKRQNQPQPECSDAAGKPGACTTIFDCPAMHRLIDQRTPSSQEIAFLKNSVCRAENNKIFLCCESPVPDLHPNKRILDEGKLCGTTILQRIIGGEEVRLGQFPWMALLFYSDRTGAENHGCGGSLIGLQHVLTAAHCVTNLGDFSLVSVRLGEHDLRNETDCQQQPDGTLLCNAPQNFGVEKVLVHEEYNSPKERDNDIALLKLDRPVVEDDFVGKICLPFGTALHRDYTGVKLTVAGFGRLGPSQFSNTSDVLMNVTLNGTRQQSCRRIIKSKQGTLSPKQICAGGEPGRDSCGGDSGGPLMAATPTGPPYSLIGVVSFGATRCGDGGIPSVNTRVSEYMNWILDKLDD